MSKEKYSFLSLTSFGENTLSQMSTAKLYISTRENLTYNIANFNSNLSIYFYWIYCMLLIFL